MREALHQHCSYVSQRPEVAMRLEQPHNTFWKGLIQG
jgi:hypothetical protein